MLFALKTNRIVAVQVSNIIAVPNSRISPSHILHVLGRVRLVTSSCLGRTRGLAKEQETNECSHTDRDHDPAIVGHEEQPDCHQWPALKETNVPQVQIEREILT
jgi:hypothetical protein